MAATVLPGVPSDTIQHEPDGVAYIDFSLATWTDFFNRATQLGNVRVRASALNAAPANIRVLVQESWFNGKSWDWFLGRASNINGVIIASRGAVQLVSCKQTCAREKSARPFIECLVLTGHFDDSCANCRVRDWSVRCDQNRGNAAAAGDGDGAAGGSGQRKRGRRSIGGLVRSVSATSAVSDQTTSSFRKKVRMMAKKIFIPAARKAANGNDNSGPSSDNPRSSSDNPRSSSASRGVGDILTGLPTSMPPPPVPRAAGVPPLRRRPGGIFFTDADWAKIRDKRRAELVRRKTYSDKERLHLEIREIDDGCHYDTSSGNITFPNRMPACDLSDDEVDIELRRSATAPAITSDDGDDEESDGRVGLSPGGSVSSGSSAELARARAELEATRRRMEELTLQVQRLELRKREKDPARRPSAGRRPEDDDDFGVV
jgi:hypothetical protein